MGMLGPSSFHEHFASLTDPRSANARHQLSAMFVIAVCAVICGAEGWEDIEEYGKAQAAWFEQILELPHGIPCDDTFRRVLSRLDPEELTQCFISWSEALSAKSNGDIVAIDGKTLRHSFDRAASKAAIHMVSAWANANRLVLGQVKVDAKSNEITAIPKRIKLLDLRGATVTIDAMGCQKEIASVLRHIALHLLRRENSHKRATRGTPSGCHGLSGGGAGTKRAFPPRRHAPCTIKEELSSSRMKLDIGDPLARSATCALHPECLCWTCTRARAPVGYLS